MAEFSYSGLDEFMLSLQEIAEIPDEVVDEMLNAQADVVVAAQRRQGKAMGVHRTGLTVKSIKKGRVKVTRDGRRVIYVSPMGTRKRGDKQVRNAEIGFVTEFGTRSQKAKPFIKTANEKSAAETTAAAAAVHHRWLESKGL
jgi:HK97 gp10 family phage protein